MAEFPALPFYTDSYLADTRHLDTEEHGAYFLMLICMWRTRGCFLPNDDKYLSRIVGVSPSKWKRLKIVLLPFFDVEDDKITHKKLTEIYEKVSLRVNRNRQNASKGGKAKSLKTNKADLANGTQSLPLEHSDGMPNQNQNQSKTPKSPRGTRKSYPEEFEEFWKTYRRQNDDKSPAFKSWERAVKGGVSPEDIISKAKEYLGSISPDKRHGEFQKRAATWLNQKGWENTYTPFGAAVAHKGSQLDILSMSDEQIANARGFDMLTGQFKTRFNKDYFANNKTQPGGSKGLKEAMIEALKKPPLRG